MGVNLGVDNKASQSTLLAHDCNLAEGHLCFSVEIKNIHVGAERVVVLYTLVIGLL